MQSSFNSIDQYTDRLIAINAELAVNSHEVDYFNRVLAGSVAESPESLFKNQVNITLDLAAKSSGLLYKTSDFLLPHEIADLNDDATFVDYVNHLFRALELLDKGSGLVAFAYDIIENAGTPLERLEETLSFVESFLTNEDFQAPTDLVKKVLPQTFTDNDALRANRLLKRLGFELGSYEAVGKFLTTNSEELGGKSPLYFVKQHGLDALERQVVWIEETTFG